MDKLKADIKLLNEAKQELGKIRENYKNYGSVAIQSNEAIMKIDGVITEIENNERALGRLYYEED